MSVSFSKSTETLTPWGQFVNGAASSTSMMTVMQPVINFQIQLMSANGPRTAHEFSQQVLQGKIKPYGGLSAGLAGVVPAMSVAFAANSVAKDYLSPFWAGVSSGIPGALPATTFERINVVVQMKRCGPVQAVRLIVQHNGPSGLLRGFVPTAGRDCTVNGALFHASGTTQSIVLGMFAGGVSTPFALVKNRMQENLEGPQLTAVQATRSVMQEVATREGAKRFAVMAATRSGFVGGAVGLIGLGKQFFPSYLPDMMHQKTS